MNLRNFRLGSTPLTIGLIFGIILALVLILYSFIAPTVDQALGSVSIFLNIGIYVIFGFLAGRRASKLTGKLTSAIGASAIAGLVSALITGILSLLLTFINVDYYVKQAQLIANKQHPVVHITSSDIMLAQAQYLVAPLVFAFLLVLIGGAIGGFLGKGRAQVPAAEEEVFTPSTPAAPETPAQDDESPELTNSSNGTGAGIRRSAASRRSRNARRNRNMN